MSLMVKVKLPEEEGSWRGSSVHFGAHVVCVIHRVADFR